MPCRHLTSGSVVVAHRYEVDPGQELFALGLSNIFGALFSSYPVTGSFSRSAVNNMVGATSQFSGLVTSLIMLLTLLVLTPVFKFLPRFCLAAIVVSSVTNLVDYNEPIYLWKVKRTDCFLWFLAFLGTLFLGIQPGILMAVGVSLLIVIYESVRPQISMLWKLPSAPIYRNIKQENSGQFVPGVIVMRIGSSMYFANVAFIRDYIHKIVDGADGFYSADSGIAEPEVRGLNTIEEGHVAELESVTAPRELPSDDMRPSPVEYVVIEMTPVISIDSTALHMLEDLQVDLKARGIQIAYSTVGNRVESVMRRGGFIDKIGSQWMHPSVHSAVEHCVQHRASRMAAKMGKSGDGDESESNGADDQSTAADSVPSTMAPSLQNGGSPGKEAKSATRANGGAGAGEQVEPTPKCNSLSGSLSGSVEMNVTLSVEAPPAANEEAAPAKNLRI